MLKRHKDLLRPLVASLRATLAGAAGADGTWQRGDLDRELERLGIAPDGTAIPIDALPNPAAVERRARVAADAYLTTAVNSLKGAEAEQKRRAAREEFVERAAYTWINRLLALRTMEARGLIEETLRANPDYEGISEALFILRQTDPARCAGADGGWWAVIEDACTAQAAFLPGLFDLSDPSVALRPSTAAVLRCITLIGGAPSGFTLAEADAAFADPDAIGWAYQFYQEAAKARVYEKLGSGGKAATRAEIAAATQLFTEPYMVQWLLQNSLGRSYHEAYPDSKLPESWAYYIRQRPEGQTAPESPRPLEALDLIDPCCGSGHFLREAFDMFAVMYRERHPNLSAAEIADRILERHLHGIDLDPRAAQLAALTLYLRAWELVKDEGARMRDEGKLIRPASSITYHPPIINIATTPSFPTSHPSSLIPHPFLQRHLRRHPQDRLLKPLLEGVFDALEQADILGSLLRPAEHIEAAMKALQQPHTVPMDFDADDAALRRTITTMARHDPAELKRMLLDRVAQSFAAEAGNADDVAAQLFGREAERGVRLLQLLDRKYAVVVTNPPYMGSKNMDSPLKKYVERNYKPAKRDLYTTFILRCLALCRQNGRVAMVTMQGWMFQSMFADLRAIPEDQLSDTEQRGVFGGLLREYSIEALSHHGRYAFSEIGNAVVAPVLFVISYHRRGPEHRIWACRLVAPRSSDEQAQLLCNACQEGTITGIVSMPAQYDFLDIINTPVVYWLRPKFFQLLQGHNRISNIADIRQGMATSDNERFLRYFWEEQHILRSDSGRWFLYAKGGHYQKWLGLEWLVVDWEYQGARLKTNAGTLYNNSHWSRIIKNTDYYFKTGLTYTQMSQGSMATRLLHNGIFDVKSISIFPKKGNMSLVNLSAFLSTRIVSYLLRVTTQSLEFHAGYTANLPLPDKSPSFSVDLASICVSLKGRLVTADPVERSFKGSAFTDPLQHTATVLHTLEGINENAVFNAYNVMGADRQAVLAETGIPAGFHPLIAGYDLLPELPADLDLPPLPQEVTGYLAAHERTSPSPAELTRIKARLRALYEAGPGADPHPPPPSPIAIGEGEQESLISMKSDEGFSPSPAAAGEGAGGEGLDDEDEGAVSGAHIPIPTETFLEELSVKMQIHPISVYWLLEELRAEGARCKPEEQRLLEDRLSVLVLRLLGHRWPRQIEAGEPVPAWADPDGIIPITPGAGETTLAERLRARLRAEDGDLGVQRTEAVLAELTGLTLEEWVRREFFKRHVRQFKYRPVAWHLASAPPTAGKGRRGNRRLPAFECMLYYHACGGDVLARIRTQYVDPLLRAERQRAEDARRANDETAAALATERIQELEAFVAKLRLVAGEGFDERMKDEGRRMKDGADFNAGNASVPPLDRWDGDGYLAPATYDDFLRQERAWRVDLNDGVRVNIAPVQLVGLLASDVLKAADAKKAIADRARWRSDERRWVRMGKLPRCGWMDERVPESRKWTELAPQRAAEQAKLEEKRRALVESRS